MVEKKQTPMMMQYEEIKSRYKEELLFFRLGDFYELFFDDALIASKELNITLTGRAAGTEEKAPMCGVPYHAAEGYITKLIKKGYKVAICEQVEDPKAVKGIVKRDVIRVITPGTVISENGTSDAENNFLSLLYEGEKGKVVLFSDVSTGEVLWGYAEDKQDEELLIDTFTMYAPTEIVLVEPAGLPKRSEEFLKHHLPRTVISPVAAQIIKEEAKSKAKAHFSAGLFVEDDVMIALGYLLHYLENVLRTDLNHINYLQEIGNDSRMILDASSLKHLEVTKNLRDGGQKGTLFSVLNRTKTPMGARLLKHWVESPLREIIQIESRQNAVEELVMQPMVQAKIADLLGQVFDFERIITRIETGTVTPRDFTALRESLRILPFIKEETTNFKCNTLVNTAGRIHQHGDVFSLLCRAISDTPPLTLKDGRVIKDGYNEELDELRSLSTNSHEWLRQLEEKIKETTGIKLKTGYNKVFGYYFEVTNTHKENVPDYFIRKQTLSNAERYITPELKEFEIKVLSAKERIINLEQSLFQELRLQIKEHILAIQETARSLAVLDALVSLAAVAYEGRYIRPSLTNSGRISIKDGRHPVIETFLRQEVFVPNDIELNHEDEEFLLITGPNMAGKSTYMRQTAILMIMAQIGSFIPAREASISPVDRIFTRVGASDDISTGQSTFMVEMKEVAHILSYATKNSLIILDEIGRGTSTFDGLSIAQAVVEYILEHIHAKTMFATHYHELTPLEEVYKELKNHTVAVKEKGKDVVFLRRIIRGAADKSYGIHVAKLAGLPGSVLQRAEVILSGLEAGKEQEPRSAPDNKNIESKKMEDPKDRMESSLFVNTVLDDLLAIDVMSLTPIEALNTLYKLQEEARKGGGR